MLLSLLAAASTLAQRHGNADALRQVGELRAAIKANPVDLGAVRTLADHAPGMLSQAARCDALAAEAGRLEQASQARWAKVQASLPVLRMPLDHFLKDFLTAEASTPAGVRQRALMHRYRACALTGVAALPEPARTCARLEEPIDDLALAREQRWLAFRGPLPVTLHTPDEMIAWNEAWRKDRERFDAKDAADPAAIRLADLERRRSRACAGSPRLEEVPRDKVSASAEPAW